MVFKELIINSFHFARYGGLEIVHFFTVSTLGGGGDLKRTHF